tara:strand:+ start:211 stop:411 length:201 start_codon:yes stop_codon:yes gene_type:complete
MQKTLINQHFFIFFVLVLFFLASGCSKSVKKCKLSPDLQRIGESAIENQKNLSETELKSAIMRCDF